MILVKKVLQRKSWILWVLILMISALFSCEKKKVDDMDGAGSLAEMRKMIAAGLINDYIIPQYQILVDQASVIDAIAQKLESEPSGTTLAELRLALKQTWLQWQKTAPFLVGPAEDHAIRAAINTYPANKEKIDENITSGNYSLGSIQQLDAGGLPALDYLINNGADAEVLADLSSEGTARYVLALSAQINRVVTDVGEAFQAPAFVSQFSSQQSAGTDVGSALGMFVNALDQHLQRFLRDGKVAIPAGVRSAGVPRPTATEAYYGGYSIELIIASLQTYHDLMEGMGPNGVSFVSLFDYLDALDRSDLVRLFREAISDAITQAEKLRDPLSGQIEENVDPVVTLFLKLQDMVTLLKADIVSALGVTVTNQDNDGD